MHSSGPEERPKDPGQNEKAKRKEEIYHERLGSQYKAKGFHKQTSLENA
jgi:hypothetical protein